jgi:hypothetical protein
MRAIDPIFVAPRVVQRDWGRDDLGEWGKLLPRPSGRTAEAWLHDAANSTDKGPLGRRLAADSRAMFGDLGRAPPRSRLVFPGRETQVVSTAPVSFWTLLEPGHDPGASVAASMRRPGERIRAYEGAAITLPAGSVALEVSAVFQPANVPADGPSLIRLPPVTRRMRATLVREEALSVEMWTLPEWSRLKPDGETCHVVTALTPGVVLDGRHLRVGETAFIPAWGRPVDLVTRAAEAKVMVAYPDRTPTAIWRHTPGPDPTAGLLPEPEPASPTVDAIAPRPEYAWAA